MPHPSPPRMPQRTPGCPPPAIWPEPPKPAGWWLPPRWVFALVPVAPRWGVPWSGSHPVPRKRFELGGGGLWSEGPGGGGGLSVPGWALVNPLLRKVEPSPGVSEGHKGPSGLSHPQPSTIKIGGKFSPELSLPTWEVAIWACMCWSFVRLEVFTRPCKSPQYMGSVQDVSGKFWCARIRTRTINEVSCNIRWL